jgi:Ca2+-binding RTX toxin-like protein
MRGSLGRASRLVTACAVAAGVLGGITSAGTVTSKAPVREEERVRVLEDFARSPLSFEVNRGQTDPRVRYLSRGSGYTVYLTEQEAVFSLSGAPSEPGAPAPTLAPLGAALRMALVGTGPKPQVTGRSPLPGVVSYFKGSNPAEWQRGIPTFARVGYQEVYPGTDLVFRGTRGALEYDFLLAPGADPGAIALRFEGAQDLRVDRHGDLVISTAVGELVHRAPVVYQEVGGDRRRIEGAYRLHGVRVGFILGAYDRGLPLVIDPVVVRYSTFLGGSGFDGGTDIAVDPYTLQAYVTGVTGSTDFPTTAGAFDQTHNGGEDAFVAKLGPTGAALSYSTFLGGSGSDIGQGIAVDGTGAAYVSGSTFGATDFPTTAGAFDQTHNGGEDAFVAKLGPTGAALSYSTFLGGSGSDIGQGIAVDGTGAAYVSGSTFGATDFPTTAGAFDQIHNGGEDAFVARLGPTGAALSYSTFLGGSSDDRGLSIAVDGRGAAYVTGDTVDADTDIPATPGAFDQTHNGGFADAFVAKLVPAGAALDYSTFLGGSAVDQGFGIAVDSAGAAYVTGLTIATDFPTTAGAFDESHNGSFDVFVTKLLPSGGALSYSTFLGGSSLDLGLGIAVDPVRAAYVTGSTLATDFPTTAGAFDPIHNGLDDAYVTKLGPAGAALSYSTFLGGSGDDRALGIAVDGNGAAYATGLTEDTTTDFPTTAEAFDRTQNGGFDAFVSRLVEPTPPPPPPPGPLSSGPSCRGLTATHAGTDGDDTITGTPGGDVIAALAGNDLITALDGNDVVCAGPGHDTATGGQGRDTIQGQDGKDRLMGGGGNDRLNGGSGSDRCLGGSGRNLARNCEKEKSIA